MGPENKDPAERIADLENQLGELKKANRQFESVVESAPHGAIIANREGKILFVNRKTEELFGYSRKKLLTLSIEDLVPTHFKSRHQQNRDSFHTHPEARPMGTGRDLYALRKDGSEFPVEIGLAPLPDSENMHVLSTIIDITERKRTELELQRHALELERSNADLENFASVASHDLQEPLRKIRTMGERLTRESAEVLSDKSKEYLARMINAGERMDHLIQALLAFSRVTSRTQPFTETELNEPVTEALSALELLIEESGGRIDVGPLPAAQVDVSQMSQLFQNLIGNALKFTSPDTAPHVEVTGRQIDEKSIEVSVRDHGIGFDEKYVDQIFDIFEKLHGRSTFEGTGVGLAICKKIVDRHGGSIEASSKPGKATEFRITLPRQQENDQSH